MAGAATPASVTAPRRAAAIAPARGAADAEFVLGRAGADLQVPRGFAHLLLFAIVAFFAIFLAWASWATLEEVTRGDGKVIPSRQVQVVQNLEGGIVAEHPGARGRDRRARPGAGADRQRARGERAAREAASAIWRCSARSAGCAPRSTRPTSRSPPEVLAEAPDVARNERALYRARRDALQSELDVLRSQAAQREQELSELGTRLDQLKRSHALALEELKITEPLAANRVVSKVQLLRLQREVNDLAGELEADHGSPCRGSRRRCARPSAGSRSVSSAFAPRRSASSTRSRRRRRRCRR